MPIYTWECTSCQRRAEVITRVDDRDTAPNACHCGSTSWIKVPSTASFVRGPNWSGGKGNWLLAGLLLGGFGLSGCATHYALDDLSWFRVARDNPGALVCTTVTAPAEIAGYYCLRRER